MRRESWLPMLIIAMGQAQMSLNINALPVSIGGIVAEFQTAPTTVGTAIVAHSVAVAGFAMLGARFAQKFGALKVFRVGSTLLLAAMVMMTFSPNAMVMIAAQVMAGLAAGAWWGNRRTIWCRRGNPLLNSAPALCWWQTARAPLQLDC